MFHREGRAASSHVEAVLVAAQDSGAAARTAIAASWRRSLLHHRLDPGEGEAPERLEAVALRRRAEAAGPLLRIASPILDRLAAAAAEAGCAVLFTDADGVILDDRLRAADEEAFAAAGLVPGACWAEAREGTNGIGTCLVERRPVIVHRDQHFRSRNIALSCMGAPIFGPDASLAAVLDLSSSRADLTDGLARLIALSVNDAARRVERELFRAAFVGARIVEAEPAEGSGPMLLAVDADDLVLGATRAARRRFRLSEADVAARRPARDLLAAGEAPQGLHAAERSELMRALARSRGNVSAAARHLGIGRATIYRKMREHGLDAASGRS